MTKRKKEVKIIKNGGRRGLIFLSAFTVFLFVAQMVLANSLSSKGKEIGQLEVEKESLLSEQTLLSGSLASLGSLERVRQDAAKIGMVEGHDNFDYLVPPRVAYNQ